MDIGHKSSDAFVVDGYRLDIVQALVHRVDEADIPMPAKPEYVGHVLANEIVDDDLAAVK